MNATIAAQMTGADILKLRKKRGILTWSLVLALGPILIYFVAAVIEHATNPGKYGPAGGAQNFSDGLRVIALFFGPLAALLIGVEAGTGDASAGVFRDLVVTGRSRLALFATRVPAALAVTVAMMLGAYALLLIGTFAFASGLATPGGSLILNGLGFTLLGDRHVVRGRRRLRLAHDLQAGRDHRLDRLADRGQPSACQHQRPR